MADTYAFERTIERHYVDPVELIWLTCAQRLGMTVRRSADVYATHDGNGLLTLSDAAGFDPDDTISQMVFHEICHWIVNGEDSFHEPDWGFELDWTVDWREYTCQRLQAALAKEHDLQALLASTGTYRPYYDAVLAAPLAPLDDSDSEAHAVAKTREALAQARRAPWAPHLDAALKATSAIQAIVAPHLPDYAPDHPTDLPPIWCR